MSGRSPHQPALKFLELTRDPAAATTPEGVIVHANQALADAVGAAPEALTGARWADLVHPEDRDRPGSAQMRLGSERAGWRWYAFSRTVDPEAGLVISLGHDVTAARIAFDEAAIGMTVTALDGRFERVNAAFGAMLGRTPDELAGVAVRDVTHPGHHEADADAIVAMREGRRDSYRTEKRYVHRDGRSVWAALSVSVVRGARGEPLYFLSQMIDITERKAFEEALASSEERFRSLAVAAPNGIYALDLDGQLLYANDRLVEISGMGHDELAGDGWMRMLHPDDRERIVREAGRAPVLRRRRNEFRIVRTDGGVRWMRTSSTSLRGRDGEPVGFVGSIEDVTNEVEALRELAAREAEYRLLADNSSDFLARHAPDGTYRYASPACETLTGYAPTELVGTSPLEHVDADDRARVADAHRHVLQDARPATVAFRMRCKDGELRWFETTTRAVHDAEGEVLELVSVMRDISDRKQAEIELSHAALHDALTGLPNRALFLDRLGLALLRAERRSGAIAVLFCDLDRFKVVNDSLGHDAGDRLLIDVAARISAALRPSDTVARFGGDEFTILCEDIAGEIEAATIAQRIVDVFSQPFLLDDGEVFLATSVGIAIARGAGDRAEHLIRDADAAMYRAKEHGKGRYEIFDEEMRADAVARLETEGALRRALERDELVLHYQPLVGVASGATVGFEALLRWEHPVRGLLEPAEFIPLAEETGLIVSIGEWVLREACMEAQGWPAAAGGPPLTLAVNVSARQLAQHDFVPAVRRVLAETGTDPSTLCLEITESAVMASGAATTAQLRALKHVGVRLAIDDFGTGYSSLVHLRRFPVDALKIDRTFVHGLGSDPQDASIAAAVISLAHALGLETIAEGIETEEQLRVLEQLGCDVGQGYLFARPQPPSGVPALVGRAPVDSEP